MSTNDSRGWSNVFKMGLHWSKKQKQKARINRQRSSEEVLNSAVNYSESRARGRRWNKTEQCREAKLTRTIERRRNTRQIDSEDYRTSQVNSPVEMLCSRSRKIHFSIGILFKVFHIWSNAVRHFINYIVFISLVSKQITRESFCGGCCKLHIVNKWSFLSIFIVNL